MSAKTMANSITAGQLIVLLALSSAASAQEWTSYGGDTGGTRYSPLKQINQQNVKNLQRAAVDSVKYFVMQSVQIDQELELNAPDQLTRKSQT
jgi:glucose dehydrogenase